MRKFSWRHLLQVGVSIGVLLAFVFLVDWQQARAVIARANPWILAALCVLYPLDRLFMAWKWHLIARAAPTCVSAWTGTRIYLASSAVGIFLPLGGLGSDVVRVAMLSRHGMTTESAVSSILLERLCGIAGAVLMLGIAVALILAMAPRLPDFASIDAGTNLLGPALVALAVGCVCVAAFLVSPPGRRLVERVRSHPAVIKYVAAFRLLGERRRLLGISIVLAWLEQWAPIIAFYIAFRGFGVDVTLLEVAAIIPLGSILERLPISVGGIGVKEAGIVVAAGLVGVSASEAFLVSLFEHSVFMLTMLPLALLYWIGRRGERAAPPITDTVAG